VKSGYVVKGGTVRGYWNTAKRVAVQNRNRSGTKVGQNRYKTGTEAVQNRDRSETEVGHLQGGVGTNRSEGNRE
jgi:hypothetical protein